MSDQRDRDFVTVMRQDWRDLLFVHWQVDPAALGRLLPPALELDTHHGAAFVGLVPFEVQRTRLPLLPPAPFASTFGEVNVRTYVRLAGNEPGVWFFSLDAGSALAAMAARVGYHLPYFAADVRLERAGTEISFDSQREDGPGRCQARWRTRGGGTTRAQPGSLSHFLVERYALYAAEGDSLWRARVAHEPYPLQEVELLHLDEDLVRAAGIEVGPSPVLHCSAGVEVRISRLERVLG